jgi:signal peptidase II
VADEAPVERDGGAAESAVSKRRRWALFGGLAAAIVVLDQLAKTWIDASFELASRSVPTGEPGGPTAIIGEFVRFAKTYNDGAIFGLFDAVAPVLGAISLFVIGGIAWYEWRYGRALGPIVNAGLGLLLGGALGNLIDRIRFGHVIDFIDTGIGSSRWYAFNVADAAVSVGIVLILIGALLGDRLGARGEGKSASAGVTPSSGSTAPPTRPT